MPAPHKLPDRGIGLAAPGKLTLYLHVLGRRPDGYHRLDALVAFTRLADRIAAAPAGRDSLAVTGPFAAVLADEAAENLAARARAAFREATGWHQPIALRIDKRLPVAAGLGGGSADAAATLVALERLRRAAGEPPLSSSALAAVAASLGADVPVCLASAPAYMGNIGEAVDPVGAMPPLPLVLVNPREPVATAAVFAARRGRFGDAARFDLRGRDAVDVIAALAARGNELTEAACTLRPIVGEMLAALAATPGCRLARLAGSGGTGFGLFEGDADARHAAQWLAQRRPGWWIAATRLRARPPIGRLAP